MVKEVSFFELFNFDLLESKNDFVRYLGYFVGEEIVGYIEYNDIYDSVDIVNIYVLEDYRGKGIGKSLMEKLISLSLGKKNITLEVSVLNDVAISLYESLGFKKVAIRRGYYKGIDGILMELML